MTGQGRFADDLQLPGMTSAYVVRSPHAHARILRIDTAAARAAPGVLAVLTRDDVTREKLGTLPCHAFPQLSAGSPQFRPVHTVLATDRARHVGDRVALVVAETVAQAKSAAELMAVDYDPLPAVTLADAVKDGAPKVWDEAPGNVSFTLERGNAAAVNRQFATAAHVTSLLYLIDLATRYVTDRQAEAGARLGALGTWLLPALLRRVSAVEHPEVVR